MFEARINAEPLIAAMSELEKRQFPFALSKALNDTAFEDVRPGWRDSMLRVFDRPKPLTLNAVLVKRAKKQNPVAEIYLRDEAAKGTPPARYLVHQVEGGTRKRKAFENLLIRAGVMAPSEFAVPGNSVVLDAFGNVPGRVITAILSDVRASRSETEYSTAASRRRRERRRTKRGGLYFYSRGDRGLPRAIYERIRTAFGVAVRPVFIFVTSVSYGKRFDAYETARDLFNRNFEKRFDAAMQHAIATAKRKGRGRR